MRLIASLLQLAGLALFTAGATVEFGWAGLLAGVGVGAVYVGLAMER